MPQKKVERDLVHAPEPETYLSVLSWERFALFLLKFLNGSLRSARVSALESDLGAREFRRTLRKTTRAVSGVLLSLSLSRGRMVSERDLATLQTRLSLASSVRTPKPTWRNSQTPNSESFGHLSRQRRHDTPRVRAWRRARRRPWRVAPPRPRRRRPAPVVRDLLFIRDSNIYLGVVLPAPCSDVSHRSNAQRAKRVLWLNQNTLCTYPRETPLYQSPPTLKNPVGELRPCAGVARRVPRGPAALARATRRAGPPGATRSAAAASCCSEPSADPVTGACGGVFFLSQRKRTKKRLAARQALVHRVHSFFTKLRSFADLEREENALSREYDQGARQHSSKGLSLSLSLSPDARCSPCPIDSCALETATLYRASSICLECE